MDDRELENVVSKFGNVVRELNRYLEPLARKWKHFGEVVAPVVLKLRSECVKLDISDEMLKAGWLPHYTTPFDAVEKCGKDIEAIRCLLLQYYENNWGIVRSEIEARLPSYKIDEEAKATLKEALDAHESGCYRCVCRVLFPEIERVVRIELFDGNIKRKGYDKFVRSIAYKKDIGLEVFIHEGLYDLSIFNHMTKTIEEKDRKKRRGRRKNEERPVSEVDELIFGLFTEVENKQHIERLKKSSIPNRHAALHGLVVYSSPHHSLNAIFIADYFFRLVDSIKSK